ncbi:MAG: AAA family ATPase [Desulfobacterales bacterium]|nr:MAG: AAA family ATPase [Desulfobacterales bacterium]
MPQENGQEAQKTTMLYLYHYGLKEKPFQDTANPKYLWLGKRQLQAFAILEHGVQTKKGITLLTGDVGTGKTILLNYLAETYKNQVLISRINNPDLDIPDFLNSLSDSLRLGASFEDKVSFLSQLILAGSNKKMILVIIDEAHLLASNLLEELSLLLKIKKNNERMVNIILAGQETSFGSLNEKDLAEINQEAPLRCHLQPLTREESDQYIHHRFRVAGASRNLFSVTALGKIYLFSGGIPRVINNICDHALLIGYSKNLEIINSAVIQECSQDFYFLTAVKDPTANLRPRV